MAYRVSQDESLHSLSMLNGVMVKISDKFIAPAKITLPNEWKPSDPTHLLSFQYDFTHEKHAIRLADEEKLIQERQELEQVERLFQNESAGESTTRKSKESGENSIERENANNEDDVEDTSDENANVLTEPVNEILMPFVIRPADKIDINSISNGSTRHNNQAIDLEEFEGTNQNPFELVELQTLNELDELRSVLEPVENFKKRKNSRRQLSEEPSNDNDIDFSIFNSVPEQTLSQPVDVNVDKLIDTEAADCSGSEMFNFPNNVAHGTLRWTRFEESRNFYTNNPFRPYMGQPVKTQLTWNMQTQNLSKSPPGTSMQYVSPNNTYWDTGKQQVIENKELNNGMTSNLTRTKSLPNLKEPSDYENVEITSARCRTNSGELNNILPNGLEDAPHGQNFPTNRIENIMKQYQFQRFSEAKDRNVSPTMQANNLGPGIPSTASFAGCTTQTSGILGDSLNYNSSNSQTVVPPQSMFTTNMIPSVSSSCAMGRYNPPYMSNTNPFSIAPNYTPISNNMNFVSNNTNRYEHSGSINDLPTYPVSSGYAPLPSLHNYQKPSNEFHSGPTLIQSRSSNNTPNIININPVSTKHNSEDYENALFHYKPAMQVQSPQPTQVQSAQPTSYLNGNLAFHEPINSFGSAMNRTQMSSGHSFNHQAVLPKQTGRPTSMDTNFNQSTSQKISTVVPTVSWLQDHTNTLSTNEKNFAYQLNAMGFPLPCVSRAVKRLGIDEPKVLDFLCLVQELKERGYHADDVEMALINKENSKEQAIAYLNMVATFKELGFEPKKIHNALQETSCDQHKALDYLTR